MTKDELHEWKVADNLTIEPIWEDMKRVFGNRQQRLASQLRSNNKILFFRADEKRQLKRVHSTNQDEHLNEFINKMQTAFPQTEIGSLLLPYSQTQRESHRCVHPVAAPHDEILRDGGTQKD